MKYLFHNFINTLRHYKASSLLNIFGMAVAFAAFYVILTQVQWGFTYNQGIEDGDRIFVMTYPNQDNNDEREMRFCRPLAENILSSASGVESYGTMTFYSDGDEQIYYLKDGDNVRKFSAVLQQGTEGALNVFGFEPEFGSFDEMSHIGTIAVSSEFARRNNISVGDYLSDSPTGDTFTAKVVAIWKNKFQENSSPGGIDMVYSIGEQDMNDWSEHNYPYFIKLHNADDKDAFELSASDIYKTYLVNKYSDSDGIEPALNKYKVSLVPIEELYYRNDIIAKFKACRSGNKTTDVSLLMVAILIIIISLINFINFFFALVPTRIKSVNTYKVFGTSRASLILSFIMESVGIVTLSLILAAVMLLAFAKTSLSGFLTAPIAPASNTLILVLTIATAIVGSAVSSIYPASYITSFQPAMALKGSFATSKVGRGLRNVLVGIQFIISLVLIICALFVKLQYKYMMKFEMGFDKEQLISGIISSDVAWWMDKNAAFEDKLRSNPDIVDLTWADGQLVNQSRMGWGHTYKEHKINYYVYPVAWNFLDVMGIDIVEGRNFTKADELSENGVIIFNEEACNEYDVTLDVSTQNHKGTNVEMAGICRSFHFRPLQYGSDSFAFFVMGLDHSIIPKGLTHIYVRIAAGADPMNVMNFIGTAVLELSPETDPDNISLHLFDEELAAKYNTEDKLSKQVTAFTLIAIILALMGVFGLVFFETQHRMKEIAIKRVLGAEVKDILAMLSRKYATIVLICFVIAAPVSYLVTERYFSNFAYHMSIQPGVFAVALVFVLSVTVALVVLRSFSAATRNPVESIKAE